MNISISNQDLARALLYANVKSFSEIATFLGVQPSDKRKMDRLKKDCKSIRPDIEAIFNANRPDAPGPRRHFPSENPFASGDLAHQIWEITKSGQWTSWGTIKLFIQHHGGIRTDNDIKDAIDTVANPWHPKNQGRSILFETLDNLGFPLYRMEYSIPEPIMEVCETAWGRLIQSCPAEDICNQGGGEELPPQHQHARR